MTIQLTEAERSYLRRTLQNLCDLKDFLCNSVCDPSKVSPRDVYTHLAKAKLILGNANLGVSFAGTLVAKHYLMRKLAVIPFDAAEKPQGAPGLDIDIRTTAGDRVIAEVKTTDPYGGDDLGAQQRESFRKDFRKLNTTEAQHKFFFVTEARTFQIVRKKYASEIPGVRIVLLLSEEEYNA